MDATSRLSVNHSMASQMSRPMCIEIKQQLPQAARTTAGSRRGRTYNTRRSSSTSSISSADLHDGNAPGLRIDDCLARLPAHRVHARFKLAITITYRYLTDFCRKNGRYPFWGAAFRNTVASTKLQTHTYQRPNSFSKSSLVCSFYRAA